MIGMPRNWIGFENIALMVYDDPELLEDILETLIERFIKFGTCCIFALGWSGEGPVLPDKSA